MPPLTWQNVSAPFSGAASRALEAASSMMGSGFDGLSAGFGAMSQRNINTASQKALAAATTYQNAETLDKSLAERGFAGTFGVEASDVDAETMKLLNGLRTSLIGNADTRSAISARDATTASNINTANINNQVSLSQEDRALAAEDRTQSAWAFDEPRRKRDILLGEDAIVRDRKAAEYVDELARTSGITTPEELNKAILTQNLPTQEQEAALKAAGSLSPDFFKPTEQASLWLDTSVPGISVDPKSHEVTSTLGADMAATNNALAMDKSDVDYAAGADKNVQLWMTGVKDYAGNEDTGNITKTILKNAVGWDAPSAEDGKASDVFASTAGRVSRELEGLVKDYPDVPKSVVAKIYESTIRSGSMGFLDYGKIQYDPAEARVELDKLNDPKTMADVKRTVVDLEKSNQERDVLMKRAARVKAEILQAIDMNAPPEVIAEKRKVFAAIAQDAAGLVERNRKRWGKQPDKQEALPPPDTSNWNLGSGAQMPPVTIMGN